MPPGLVILLYSFSVQVKRYKIWFVYGASSRGLARHAPLAFSASRVIGHQSCGVEKEVHLVKTA